MTTILFTHPACLGHDAGEFHPESPERLRAVLGALESEEFAHLLRAEAPEATVEQIGRVHGADFISFIRKSIPAEGRPVHLDPDTLVGPGSWEAALRAAGAVVAAVDAVARGECRNAFCAVRPPGHHAERAAAMGFCLFNNVAIGALHARAAYGFQRIAVLDIDVHHGNGTQDAFFDDAGLFYASTHQEGAYPGTGFTHETGVAGNILNLPLPPGCSSLTWRQGVADVILPAMRHFRPDFILISAGFDAHAADPLAHMRLATADYHWVAREVCDLADAACGGRVVSVLEGGYDLAALAHSAAAHVRGLMGY